MVDGEEVLSTLNLNTAKSVLSIFEEVITPDAVRKNEIPARHQLMLKLMLAGDSKLTKAYFEAKELLSNLTQDYLKQFPKGSAKHAEARSNALSVVGDTVFDKTGWKF